MNQKTRTALYSVAICACIISAACAVILTINARNQKPKTEVTAIEAPEKEEEQPKQDRPRRRQRRGVDQELPRLLQKRGDPPRQDH